MILALWGALADFMIRNDLDTMTGRASIGMRDGGHMAASLWDQLRKMHLTDRVAGARDCRCPRTNCKSTWKSIRPR